MKALVLAAGYATRLYPLTEHTPKPLLDIAGKPLINYIVEKIAQLPQIEEIFVVTNDRFYQQFIDWNQGYLCTVPISIINDHTTSNDDRLGTVGDIHYVIKEKQIADDLLVIAGDNLFGFSLAAFHQFYQDQGSRSTVAFCDLGDTERVRGKYGVGIVNGPVLLDFEEKPLEPRSSLASTACYLFSKDDLPQVGLMLQSQKADAPGELIKWLVQHSKVHGFRFSEHWFDIGSVTSLEEARELYK
jgi:glucose-1-phosphate thymidylyltransferase